MNGDGYTRFPNSILEQIMSCGFNATQMSILLYVVRNTYGWNTSFCDIPLSRIASAIGKHKNGVAREVEQLITDNVLCVENEPTHRRPRTVYINTNFNEWSNIAVGHTRVLLSQSSGTHHCVTGESQQSVTPESQCSVTPESQQSVTHIKKELNKYPKERIKEKACGAFLEKDGEIFDSGAEDDGDEFLRRIEEMKRRSWR